MTKSSNRILDDRRRIPARIGFPGLAFLAVLAVVTLPCCAWLQENQISKSARPTTDKIRDMDPLEFLIFLKSNPDDQCSIVKFSGPWVSEEHLPALFELLNSDEKCASVDSAIASPHVDHGKPTTIGREAGFIIQSFKTRTYPPPPGSSMTSADKERLKAWWADYGDGSSEN